MADATTTIGDECEAYLSGRLVEHLLASGDEVPTWAWLNKLAHASVEELEAVALGSAAYGRGHDRSSWNQSVTVVAADLLSQAGGDAAAVRAVQTRLLVPFELAAIESGRNFPMTPALLVSVARAVLRRHPSVGP